MFDNLKNIAALMGQARQMREHMEQLQKELAQKTVEADSGAGAVRVVMNGRFQVLSIHLDRPLLATLTGSTGDAINEADQRMIEDLIVAAVNAAMTKAQELAGQEIHRLTGMNLPGLEKLMGG